mgnify:CR=1 FL=1
MADTCTREHCTMVSIIWKKVREPDTDAPADTEVPTEITGDQYDLPKADKDHTAPKVGGEG